MPLRMTAQRIDRNNKKGGLAFFRLALRLFLALAQRHRLLEGLTHFIEPFVIEVVNTLGALDTQVYQFSVIAHGVLLSNAQWRQ
jgi:hypothetical protein